MTLALVTLTIIGSLTLTWFSRGSTSTATLATPLFARPFASLRAWAGCSTSHARLPPPATTFSALSRPHPPSRSLECSGFTQAGREDPPHGPVPLPKQAEAGWTGQESQDSSLDSVRRVVTSVYARTLVWIGDPGCS